MDARTKVFQEIDSERRRQEVLYGRAHDDARTWPEWVALIVMYLGRSMDTETTTSAAAWSYRAAMVKVAAISVAAIETFDRRRAK